MENLIDGLTITHSNDGSKDNHFEWGNIRKRKKKPLPTDIEKWSNKDFYNHILCFFEKRNDVNFPKLSLPSGSAYIGYVRSKFLENFKISISNKQLLNYINDSIDYTVNKRKSDFFDIKYLSSLKRMNLFLNKKNNIDNNMCSDILNISEQKVILSESILRASYNLNCSTFMRKYGFIIPISYLIHCEKTSREDALNFVFTKISDILEKDIKCWEVILENTKKLGPYNTSLKIDGMKEKIIEIKNKFKLNMDGFVLRFYAKYDVPDFMRKGK
jgi:hypothetical protein